GSVSLPFTKMFTGVFGMPCTTDTCAVAAACAGAVASMPATSRPAIAAPTNLNRLTTCLLYSSLHGHCAVPSVMGEYVRSGADGCAGKRAVANDSKLNAGALDQLLLVVA